MWGKVSVEDQGVVKLDDHKVVEEWKEAIFDYILKRGRGVKNSKIHAKVL